MSKEEIAKEVLDKYRIAFVRRYDALTVSQRRVYHEMIAKAPPTDMGRYDWEVCCLRLAESTEWEREKPTRPWWQFWK